MYRPSLELLPGRIPGKTGSGAVPADTYADREIGWSRQLARPAGQCKNMRMGDALLSACVEVVYGAVGAARSRARRSRTERRALIRASPAGLSRSGICTWRDHGGQAVRVPVYRRTGPTWVNCPPGRSRPGEDQATRRHLAARREGHGEPAAAGPLGPDVAVTHILVVTDPARSRDFWVGVLGAELYREYGGTSVVLRFAGTWLLLVSGGGPTADKPAGGLPAARRRRPGQPRDDAARG